MFLPEPDRWLVSAAARVTAQLIAIGTIGAVSLAAGAENDSADLSSRPLAPYLPRSPGSPLFTVREPEASGVRTENRFADPKMWGELYQESEGGSLGTGVAIGDYDGDGRPDIFVVSKTESCRLFRNLGDYKFEDVTEKAGVADLGAEAGVWKQGVSFVDITNDGRLDLYLCRFNAPNLLYVNQGDGTFKEQAAAFGLAIKDSSVMAAFADYDRDGWLDVYIATNILETAKRPNGQRGYLLRATPQGKFVDVSVQAGITGETQSHSATWWDYDNDGWPDLYVANDYGVGDKLYHNNRDGTLTDAIDAHLPHTSFYSMGSDLGDVNNDGLIDFLVADMAAATHEKDQRGVADARGRTPDLETPGVPRKAHRSALLLNTGTGRALEAAYLAGIAATDWTWSVRLEDLDNDGRLDLFVTNGYNRDPSVDVATRMRNAESPAERIRIMHDSPVLAEKNFAFRNLGDLEFENVSTAWGLDQKGVSFGTAFGDLGGTGNLDLIHTNYQAGATLLRNGNATGHRIVVDLRGTASNRFGVGATVRLETAAGIQVRQLWLARGYMSTSEPVVHFGLGEDTEIRRLTVTWPSGRRQVFENLPVDRRYTITEPAAAANSAAISTPPVTPPLFNEIGTAIGLRRETKEEPVDETSVQRLLPQRLNRRGPALAVSRVTSAPDSPTLIAIGGTTVTPAQLLLATGNVFNPVDTTQLLPRGAVNDGPVLLFEADGDGFTDLLVTKGGNTLPQGSPEYQPQLWRGRGDGKFAAAPNALPALTFSVGTAVAADFDHSGRLGLFLGGRVATGEYPFPPQSALLANRGGRFEDVTEIVAPALREVGMVTAAVWSDVDGDGWADLLLTLEWGQVRYFHNEEGRSLVERTEAAGFASAGTGWWTSIVSADFNGDGRPDFVVGNVGLNTQYRASPSRPALLFSGDFKGDGTHQLIEAYYEGDKLYPWRSRRDLGAVLPAILKKYPRTDFYARATLAEILGQEKLAKAQRFAATELRSGIFLSQPDRTYRFEPLPRIAQIAPLQGMVAGDCDGDGHMDVYALQNSFAPIPAVGRYDGGLSQWLKGDGHGGFTCVTPAESGLVVPGDAKALVVLDFNEDAWPDFLVSRNHESTLAFQAQGDAGHRRLRLQLQGPAGNPAAIGASVSLRFTDGSTQTQEIAAGAGYLSQSSSELFFGWPNATKPTSATIRWPSGNVSEHPILADKKRVVIRVP